jgi:flavin reductase (DIM6/NTAB) family NADH-FMN oxidoreductase RutF
LEINPKDIPYSSLYKIMIGSILPRPIGWISTVNQQGQPNLAPYSFFNAVCSNPPTVLFCPSIRATDGDFKDTLYNVRSTGEFVVNIVTAPLAEAMVATSAELPGDINEFEVAGLTAVPSEMVRAPRVAESPIHYECVLNQIIEIGGERGGGAVVIGTVVHVHVDDSVLIGQDKIDLAALQPVGRLAGASYCLVDTVFDIARPPSQIKPGDA